MTSPLMQSNIPNLFVIGAAKSGTTTLYSILVRHPQVFMSRSKATRFFLKDRKYEKGLDWYLQTYFDGAEIYPVRGEATPSYLAQARITAPRIRETIPGDQTKFIVIFRNPVERAYSHYWYNRNRKGSENISFENALAIEEQSKQNMEASRRGRSHTQDYFKNGEYSASLKEYFIYFKREQFLFLLFEDLFSQQFQSTTARITEFLNIGDTIVEYSKENQSQRIGARPAVKFVRKQRHLMGLFKSFLPQSIQNVLRDQYARLISRPVKYPPMKQSTREMLLEKYTPGIMELEQIIGRDLEHWRKV